MRNFKHILKNTVAIILLATSLSCVTSKEIIYFQDEPLNALNAVAINSEIAYKPNDLLTINVSAIDPATVMPFNLPVITNSSTSLDSRGEIRMQTYIIDQDGNIDFPVLGTLKLGGLTREQATLMFKKQISEFVKDPIINIRLTNFTVTVLGEVNNPGTYIVEEERISFIEALGLAGDLTIHGIRNNIFLIREENGVKRFTKFDLTSINVVNNPNYYLQQNDILYVEPNSAKIRSASYNQNYVLIISAVGTLATIAAILIR
ncbi:polysaccharide biosynthesis/export family protein [Bizionia arctica]|uniref:Polysaccharide biosynthesis protein n=1 Tax=Bizionia arctica TaxID=1495645 RepID=A0A917GJ50_9FLAO|nr:polysaccharide biosynthesis/export family protein [Bizionia arctica]GGG48523.1 polysaccharide biosynthesis protein [Bizionia arctica]